ncbi:DUF4336 domain-containing protein [Leptodesmis sp.]|uniref:DUF4336 domain-containing protein n=1 Tax=Leptodesmis sp. TaxID=3100501 RepID=UPI00405352BD
MKRHKHSPHPLHRARDWSWPFWPLVPLYPHGKRRTVCREIVEDWIWSFDQLQGLLYAVVPIRMTVIRLEAGGLLVYAPIASTRECLREVEALVAKYGPVKYIILPTSSGLEHKVFVGPFARRFPQAQVYVAPHQWSYPFNLPLRWLGFPAKRTQELPEDNHQVPFANEFDYAVLDINLGRGSFAEVALFHRRSHTLLLTDSILSIPEEPPAIVQLDPYPLLFHARDSALEPIVDTPENRRQGWQRIALFAIYFRPSTVERLSLKQSLQNLLRASDRSLKAYLGFMPWRWQENWHQSFEALRGQGRPFVAPILQILILVQAPQQVLEWCDRVAQWDFHQIIPCHFEAPIAATPAEFRQAFAFLEEASDVHSQPFPLTEQDFAFLKELEATLIRYGIATPAKYKQ